MINQSLAPTILVVDDEPIVRMTTSEILRDYGFNAIEAACGNDAIELVETLGHNLTLVFSDVQMPGEIDGCALAEWVKTHRPGLPVILASGQTAKASPDIMRKPYDYAELVRRIERVIKD